MQTLLSHHHAVSVCALPWKVTGRHTHTPYSSSWPPKKQSWLRYSPLPKVHTHIHAHNERGKRTKREGALKTVETRCERLAVTKEIWRCFFSAFIDVIIHVSVCYVLLCASAIKLKQWHFYSKVCSFFFCHIRVTFSSKKHTYLYLFFFSLIHFHLFSLCIILLQRDQTPSWSALYGGKAAKLSVNAYTVCTLWHYTVWNWKTQGIRIGTKSNGFSEAD